MAAATRLRVAQAGDEPVGESIDLLEREVIVALRRYHKALLRDQLEETGLRSPYCHRMVGPCLRVLESRQGRRA